MAAGIITDTSDIFALENLYNAYLACRRRKRNTVNCLRFEARLADNLCDLRQDLVSRTYRPSTSICFIQKKPKMREIFAADFRDRVVHHLLVGYLEPIYERIFVHDSYACRVGKGVHGGVARLRSFLNKVTANGTIPAWYLKLDIRGFFMNLDKETLYGLVCRKTKRDAVRWLAARIIFHDCTREYTFKGQRSLFEMIPPHKTLFKVPHGKGLPIGNLTSQFFANVYLNELDQFIKRKLGCKYYLRYCDDFILLAQSREQLGEWYTELGDFLWQRLQLEFNPAQYKLRSVSSGIDFLGYVIRRRYVLVRRRVVNNLRERLDRFEQRLGERSAARRGRLLRVGHKTSKNVGARPASDKGVSGQQGSPNRPEGRAPTDRAQNQQECRSLPPRAIRAIPGSRAGLIARRAGLLQVGVENLQGCWSLPPRAIKLPTGREVAGSRGAGSPTCRQWPVAAYQYPPAVMEKFRATVNSYLGHFKWADSHRLAGSLFDRYPVLRASFYRAGGKVMPRYIPDFKYGSLHRQYLWWINCGMRYC